MADEIVSEIELMKQKKDNCQNLAGEKR